MAFFCLETIYLKLINLPLMRSSYCPTNVIKYLGPQLSLVLKLHKCSDMFMTIISKVFLSFLNFVPIQTLSHKLERKDHHAWFLQLSFLCMSSLLYFIFVDNCQAQICSLFISLYRHAKNNVLLWCYAFNDFYRSPKLFLNSPWIYRQFLTMENL